jgi:hypothetical protein
VDTWVSSSTIGIVLFEGFADYTNVATTEIFDNNGDYRGATERKDLRLLKEHLTPDKYQSWLGELRRNMGNYIPFLYVFAPRLVGMKRWNASLENWEKLCEGSSKSTSQHDRHSCNFDQLLSVSDEAFLLLVIDNYIGPWHAEMMSNNKGLTCMDMLKVCDLYVELDVFYGDDKHEVCCTDTFRHQVVKNKWRG